MAEILPSRAVRFKLFSLSGSLSSLDFLGPWSSVPACFHEKPRTNGVGIVFANKHGLHVGMCWEVLQGS